MGVFVAICLIQLSIVLHEVGHALAFRAKGIEIDTIALGIPIPGIPKIVFRVRGVKVITSMLLVGGFVQIAPEGERQKAKLSYGEQALINGAGILANIGFAIVLLLGIGVTSLCIHWPVADAPKAFLVLGGGFAAMALLWVGRRIFCSYLVPILGVGQFLWLLYDLIVQRTFPVSGPIGIGRDVVASSTSVLNGVIMGALLSAAIGLTNTLPLVPLDGGQTVLALVRKYRPEWGNWVMGVGLSLVFILIIATCFNDIHNLVHLHHFR